MDRVEPENERGFETVVFCVRPVAERESKPEPTFRYKFEVEAVVEKKLVVVALVVVELTAVKFCKVLEPVTKRLVGVKLVATRLVVKKLVEVALVVVEFTPVKFCRVDEPLMRRLVKVPRPLLVIFPALRSVAKRLVELAVVPKKLVLVALVEVEFPVMFKLPSTVEEAVEMKPANVSKEVVALCREPG